MPVPSPRNSIRIARGNYADLAANVNEIGEGELCFALDQNKFYSKSSDTLVEVGGGTALATLGQIQDVDIAGVVDGQFLRYNSTSGSWEAEAADSAPVDSVNGQTGVVVIDADDISDTSTTNKFATQAELDKLAGVAAGAEVNAVDSVAGKTGAVTLVKADITDFSDADYATAAQGATADTAVQPGDLATVATSGSYNDLTDQPTIPVVDPDTVVTDAAPTFTATVQTTERTITAGAFDLATGNHWTCGAITVPAPTNAAAGTSGLIRITAGPVVWNTVFKFPGGTAPTIASFPAIIPFYVQDSSNILMGNVAEGIA